MGSRKHTLAHNREKQMFCVYNEKVCLRNEIVLLLPKNVSHVFSNSQWMNKECKYFCDSYLLYKLLRRSMNKNFSFQTSIDWGVLLIKSI